LLSGFTWLESSFDDAGATEGGLEALVGGFSLDGLFVTGFALQPEAGQPGNGVEEAKECGWIGGKTSTVPGWQLGLVGGIGGGLGGGLAVPLIRVFGWWGVAYQIRKARP